MKMISSGYIFYCDDIRLYTRIYADFFNGAYVVCVKLPKHKDLHIVWDMVPQYWFHGDTLCFRMEICQWIWFTERLQNVFEYIWFT